MGHMINKYTDKLVFSFLDMYDKMPLGIFPPTKLEQELDNEAVGESISGFDDFTEHINDAKKMKNKDLGEILIRNRIKDPTTGNAFYIDNHNRVLVKGGSNTLNRTQLTELLKKEYKPGELSTCKIMKEVLMKNGFEKEWKDITLAAQETQQEWVQKVELAMKEREKQATEEGIERTVKRGQMSREHAEKVMSESLTFKTYLDCANRSNGTWLKTRLRANQIDLFDVLAQRESPQWPEGFSRCWLCHNSKENVQHFVIECKE
jgi:hypothetical protein